MRRAFRLVDIARPVPRRAPADEREGPMMSSAGVVLMAVALMVAGGAAQQSTERAPAAKAPMAGVVNLNTATVAQLESLPGIGARTAERIVEYRQKNGGFKKIEELMNVQGVGEKSFLKLKNRSSP
jgi:comEA protein